MKPDLDQKSILVVDDEQRNWLLIRDIIELCNGQAIWAETGMQAIDRLTEENDIRLVFMDLQLPFMSGTETIRKIREFNPDIPIIAQTAFSEQEILNKCKEAGCNKYILKPIDFKEVYMVLNEYVK